MSVLRSCPLGLLLFSACLSACLSAPDERAGGEQVTAEQGSITSALEETTFSDLLRSLALVAEVEVEEVTGRHGVTGRREVPAIWSDVELRLIELFLSRDLARKSGEVVTVTLLGGTVGDQSLLVSSSTRLEKGDRLLVFVRDLSQPRPFAGGSQGVLRIVDGRVYSSDMRPVVAIGPAGLKLARRLFDRSRGPALKTRIGVGATRVRPEETALSALPVEQLRQTLRRLTEGLR